MCTGLEVALISGAMSAAGAGASMAGQASQARSRSNAMNAQTQLSAGEFDTRHKLAQEIFGENTGIDRATYDELNSLTDEQFQVRTGLSKQAFSQLNEIDRAQIVRDAAAATDNTAQLRNIRLGRDATRDSARATYDSTLAGANTTQTDFRNQADRVAQELIAAFSAPSMAGRQAKVTSDRDATVRRAIGAPSAAIGVPTVDQYSQEAYDRALLESALGAKVGGYTDALGAGERVVNSGGEKTAFIKDASRRSIAPLASELNLSSLKFNNAGDSAADKGRFADADLDAALRLSDTRRAGETRGVTDYTSAMDNAYGAFFGNRTNSAGARGDALINANQQKLAGANQVSSNLDSSMRGITDFRMANAGTGWAGGIGTLLSALTPTINDVAKRKAFAKAYPNTPPPVL